MPRGEHNEMIQAIWSPRMCLVNKRVNRHKLNDRHINRTEKAITFEGPTHFTEEKLSAPLATAKVKEVCKSFTEHFKSVEHHYCISRMVLYFKEDRKSTNTLWLLFSSCFRITELKFKGSTYQHSKLPVSLTPQFQGLHVDSRESYREKSPKASSKSVKRYRVGYLQNILVEDINMIAKAALSSGMVDEDEGAMIGLMPLSQLPLPTSMQNKENAPGTPSSTSGVDLPDAETTEMAGAPNDTIKSEMLLERIFFNKKTKRMRSNLRKWQSENKKLAYDLDSYATKKTQLAAGLQAFARAKQQAAQNYYSKRPRSLPKLETLRSISTPVSSPSPTGKICPAAPPEQLPFSADAEHRSVTPVAPVKEDPFLLVRAPTETPRSLFPVTTPHSPLSSNVGSLLTERTERAELTQRTDNRDLEAPVMRHAGSLSAPVPQASKKGERKPSNFFGELRGTGKGGLAEPAKEKNMSSKGLRVLEALEMLSQGDPDEMLRSVVKDAWGRKNASKDQEFNAEATIARVMPKMVASYEQYYEDEQERNCAWADELNDQIYGWYSEISLTHKPADHYFFTLPRSLAMVMEEQFTTQMQMLNIMTYRQYEALLEAKQRQRSEHQAALDALPSNTKRKGYLNLGGSSNLEQSFADGVKTPNSQGSPQMSPSGSPKISPRTVSPLSPERVGGPGNISPLATTPQATTPSAPNHAYSPVRDSMTNFIGNASLNSLSPSTSMHSPVDPSSFGLSDDVQLPSAHALGENEAEVTYAIIKSTKFKANEFHRFLQRLRDFRIQTSASHVSVCLEGIQAQLGSVNRFLVMEAIKGYGRGDEHQGERGRLRSSTVSSAMSTETEESSAFHQPFAFFSQSSSGSQGASTQGQGPTPGLAPAPGLSPLQDPVSPQGSVSPQAPGTLEAFDNSQELHRSQGPVGLQGPDPSQGSEASHGHHSS